ncbi:MAG: hypothetical protein Q4C70_01005 [Planctomycetia bacterium]|nr:hypothetical protein [Planctomycetia bacterium]
MSKTKKWLSIGTMLLLAGVSGVSATGAVWNVNGSGEWTTEGNWTGGVPNVAGSVADFSAQTPSGTATVNLASGVTTGEVKFGDASKWTTTGSTLTLDNGTGAGKITVENGTTATFGSLASSGTVDITGGGTVIVVDGKNVANWSVTGATLDTTGLDTVALGNGTVTLNEGAILKSGGNKRRRINNNIIINGNTTIHSQGWDLGGTLSGNGTITVTGGWQMVLHNANPNLNANWVIKQDFIQLNKAGALGNGKVTINSSTAAGLTLGYNDATISNTLDIQSNINFFAGGGLNRTVTLTGALTGTGSVIMKSNQYSIVGTTNLQGDASDFSGTWYLHQDYKNGNTGVLADVYTVTTNNTNAAKVNGADSRFGSGTIHMGRVVVSPYAGTKAFIHNNIAFDQNTATGLDGKTATFRISSGDSLTLTGQISGAQAVTVDGGGELILNSTASNLTSTWNTSNVKITFDNSNGKSPSLGTGKLIVNETKVGTKGTGNLDVRTPIQLDGTLYTELTRPLYFYGNLTGSGNIVMNSGGYTFGMRGDNRNYTGNILINNDWLNTDNANDATYENGADLRFGQGNLYFINGYGVSGGGEGIRYVANDIYIDKTGGSFWNGKFQLQGILTTQGNISSRETVANRAFITSHNKIQGNNATFTLPVTMAAGSVLAPGIVDAVNFDGTTVTDSPIGTLKFTGGLTLSPESILQLDVATISSYDKIELSGDKNDLSLKDVTVELNFMDTFNIDEFDADDSFLLIQGANITDMAGLELLYDADLIADAYYGATLDFALNAGNLYAVASYDKNMVPEPGTITILLIGLTLSACQIRRKK